MRIELRTDRFEPLGEIKAYQDAQPRRAAYGASAIFIGTLRDMNQGAVVQSMFLEHYPGMTEQRLLAIWRQAAARWALLDCLVLHRVGRVALAEAIVLVAIWSLHRGDALDACRFIIEELKHTAPFWKKERLADSERGRERWVEQNTDGYTKHVHKDRA